VRVKTPDSSPCESDPDAASSIKEIRVEKGGNLVSLKNVCESVCVPLYFMARVWRSGETWSSCFSPFTLTVLDLLRHLA
jgi:hypothetical protein